MGVNTTVLGAWFDGALVTVAADRIRAYAAGIDETDPRLTTGTLAPPLFGVTVVGEAMRRAVDALLPPDATPADNRSLEPGGTPRLHGEQDIVVHRLIRAGDRLLTRATPVGVHTHAGGTSAVIHTATTDADGVPIDEQWWTVFIPRWLAGVNAGEPAPDHRLPEVVRTRPPLAVIEQRPAPDQTFRYADGSGDHTRFHLDGDFARSVGLPGIILHGLCTMAFAGRAVAGAVAGSDQARLRRLAVRMARPAFPGETLATHIWADGAGRYRFETRNPAGTAVLRHGLAEITARRQLEARPCSPLA